MVREVEGWIGLIANHSDPWVELVLTDGNVRTVKLELTRISLTELTHCLADWQSSGKNLNILQARLSKLDDRWMHTFAAQEEMFSEHFAVLRERVECIDQAIGNSLMGEVGKLAAQLNLQQERLEANQAIGNALMGAWARLEGQLNLQQQESLEALSDIQSEGAQMHSILHGMRDEQERRFGARLRRLFGLK
jgi:hypothetical protein